MSVERNILLVYKGQTGSKKHTYIVVSSKNGFVPVGSSLNFSGKALSVPVGKGIRCASNDGNSFGSFTWVDENDQKLIEEMYGEKIPGWTTDERLRIEEQKIERANKKPAVYGFDERVKEIVNMTKKLTTREKMLAINYISNQILKG